MSLLAKLSGKPQTFEEFVKYAKRNPQTPVDLKLPVYCLDEQESVCGIWTFYAAHSQIQAGKISFPLAEYDWELLEPYDVQLSLFGGTAELLRETIEKNAKTEQQYVADLAQVRRKLLANGVKVRSIEMRVSGSSSEEVEKKLRALHLII